MTPDPGTDLAPVPQAEIDAIAAAQEQEFDSSLLQVPILKIGQRTTREVEAGDAETGTFINTLSGDVYGEELGFIVAFYNRGRFASDRDSGRAYVAFNTDTIPDSWSELVGDEFVGTAFSEYPDAEERFKDRVNAKEIEWGHGPLISTTHNYTGFAVVSAEEGSDQDEDLHPVRLSLQRTNMPAVRKFTTIKRAVLRSKPFWDLVFDLSSFRKEFSKGPAYLLNVKSGRETTADERGAAAKLATAVVAGNVAANDSAADEASPPVAAVEPEAPKDAAAF